jgi:hypothetical protein
VQARYGWFKKAAGVQELIVDFFADGKCGRSIIFWNPRAIFLITCRWESWVFNLFLPWGLSRPLAHALDVHFTCTQAICAPDYVPTDVDVFNCYTRTTGIVDSEISFEGGPHMVRIILFQSNLNSALGLFLFLNTQFSFYPKLFDLGGQRNERRKWALTLDNCAETAAILFVIPISAYDEVCQFFNFAPIPFTSAHFKIPCCVLWMRSTFEKTTRRIA